eukprot:1147411-Pelagomonas_calceolata.AAC.4
MEQAGASIGGCLPKCYVSRDARPMPCNQSTSHQEARLHARWEFPLLALVSSKTVEARDGDCKSILTSRVTAKGTDGCVGQHMGQSKQKAVQPDTGAPPREKAHINAQPQQRALMSPCSPLPLLKHTCKLLSAQQRLRLCWWPWPTGGTAQRGPAQAVAAAPGWGGAGCSRHHCPQEDRLNVHPGRACLLSDGFACKQVSKRATNRP